MSTSRSPAVDPASDAASGSVPGAAVKDAGKSVIGIAWYREEDYDRIMAVMADGASFPKTWASWRQKAVRMERELKRQGLAPVRVDVDPGKFERWCADQALAPDSEARNQYVEAEAGRRTPAGSSAKS